MRYEKPEIVGVSSAIDTVQSTRKIGPCHDDTQTSNCAYEADE